MTIVHPDSRGWLIRQQPNENEQRAIDAQDFYFSGGQLRLTEAEKLKRRATEYLDYAKRWTEW